MRPARTRTQQTDSKSDRRSGFHSGRRLARAAAIAAVGFSIVTGATAAVAQADSSTVVVVNVSGPGGTQPPVNVTLGELQSQPCTGYSHAHTTVTENGLQGPVAVDITPQAWAIGTVLQCVLNIGTTAVNFVQVLDASGNPEDTNRYSTLSASDLMSPSDYVDPTQTPAVGYAGNDSSGAPDVYYYRPPRDGSDLDFLDELTPDGQPLTLDVVEGGPQLNVTASASPSGQVDPGTPITFSASVTPTDTANLTYKWSFGSGAATATATGPTVTATYEQPGTWWATVVVTGPDGAGGTVPIEVDVGPAPTDTAASQSGTTPTVIATITTWGPTPTTKRPTTTTKKAPPKKTSAASSHNHPTQPVGGGRTVPSAIQGAGAPATPPTATHTTPTHTTSTRTTQTTTTRTTTTQTRTQTTATLTTTTQTATPQTTAQHSAAQHPATPPSPTPSGPSAPASQPAGPTVEHAHPLHRQPHPTTDHTRRPAPVARTHGQRVVGRVLASVDPASPSSSPLVSSAPAPNTTSPLTTAPLPTGNRHAATSPSPLAIILSALVVVALLALGAVNEMRGGIDWRSLRARLPRR